MGELFKILRNNRVSSRYSKKQMDINTWNRLTKDEQEEVKHMSADFIKEVINSNASDGRDFWMKYEVRTAQEYCCIFEKSSSQQFGKFKSKSKKVMNALMADAVQNYGR